jgi:putative ABC transport system permease protein
VKLLRLAFKNVLRNRRRSILTLAGVAIFTAILCFMQTVVTSMNAWEAHSENYARVGVMSKTNLTVELPLSYEEYLKGLPDVATVHKHEWFGGIIRDRERDFFANFACDPENFFEIWEEYRLPEDQYRAWLEDRQGAMIGSELAKRFGWTVGSRVVLTGTIYPVNPEFTVRGIYTSTAKVADVNSFYFHWKYFHELTGSRGTVGMYWLKVKSREAVPGVIRTIDNHFANSADPTKSMTEKEFARMFTSMMGNVVGLVRAIGSVVVLIMVVIVANTMALSARERASEVAMMRTLGFSRPSIMTMVLAESTALTLTGAALGVALPLLLLNVIKIPTGPHLPGFVVAESTVIGAALVALVVGPAAGFVPGWLTARVPIVEGLRRVG